MDFSEEGSWSLSFAGAGFLGLYHVGVTQCLRERAPRLLQGARRFYGSSAGALNALSIVCDKSADFCCSNLMSMVHQVNRLSLGIFHPAYGPIEHITEQLRTSLPRDSHILASQRLGISLTRWPDGRNLIVTHFASRDELIQALVCTLYFPVYCGNIPPAFRGERYVDGALSNNLPFADSPSTITVSPFNGTVDICPQSDSASMHELNAFNASFQISTRNFFLGFRCLFPPKAEMVADSCRQGYLDGLRFLETRGLYREPVFWLLASREPPPPEERPWHAGRDQDKKSRLAARWDVPNVLVENVPDFGQLSPELETALKKACQQDSWTRFQCSLPVRVLTYLLLPCTLPFEYAYFRSRRLLQWLPEVPDDLCWMQGLLKTSVVEVCSRARTLLLRSASLPTIDAVDAAASEGPASGLRPTGGACSAPATSAP